MQRKEDDVSRANLVWKPKGKILRGRPRNREMYAVEDDLNRMGVQE